MKTKAIYGGAVFRELLLVSLLAGCSAPHSQTGLSAKESRMSKELLRSQVLRYKAEAEKDLTQMAKFFDQYTPLESPFTPEMAAAISTALAALAENEDMRGTMFDYSLSLDRYFLFYDKLKEKGGDMRDLEIDFRTPIEQKYYSPPIEEPTKVTDSSAMAEELRGKVLKYKEQTEKYHKEAERLLYKTT